MGQLILVIFETHATSLDNEKGIASGWRDVRLSALGKKQAKELGHRYNDHKFKAVFCSDLERSVSTGKIAFAHKHKILVDKRLRECNYGDLTGSASKKLDSLKKNYIKKPFPNGESYLDCIERMASFLKDLNKKKPGPVLIIGHRATQYALEHLINKKTLKRAITEPWGWQPGWVYMLKN